uniref:Uncharacterized protein n=1 Tax=Rangifer tarandus platyrhynchus TaxID=3082113 RepID=A0ACB0E8A9_RANTA|nr:unnamed protein product [Rangifer tarandus platyrhynchus]
MTVPELRTLAPPILSPPGCLEPLVMERPSLPACLCSELLSSRQAGPHQPRASCCSGAAATWDGSLSVPDVGKGVHAYKSVPQPMGESWGQGTSGSVTALPTPNSVALIQHVIVPKAIPHAASEESEKGDSVPRRLLRREPPPRCSWEWERACGNWLGTSRAGCRTCRVATRSCLSVNTLWEGKTYKAPEQPQNRKPPAARNWKPPAAPARERELMSGPGDAQESQQTGLACGESVHGHMASRALANVKAVTADGIPVVCEPPESPKKNILRIVAGGSYLQAPARRCRLVSPGRPLGHAHLTPRLPSGQTCSGVPAGPVHCRSPEDTRSGVSASRIKRQLQSVQPKRA